VNIYEAKVGEGPRRRSRKYY